MKNPRISLHKVPGHRKIGADIAGIINQYLDEFPEMQSQMHAAVGDTSKKNSGPSKELIEGLVKIIEAYFRIAPGDRDACSLTQLHQPIYRA